MCEVDWALVREWVGTLAEVATAALAAIALFTWRAHLRGATKYKVAHQVLEEARLLRYFFYDARNPWVDAAEFPPDYHAALATFGERTAVQEAKGWAYVYNARYRMVRRQILVLARLRARAGAVLGEDMATAIEQLVRKAGELHGLMRARVEQYRAGDDVVNQRPNREWNARVREGVEVPPEHDDRFSREFEERLKGLDDRLERYK